MPNHYVGFPSVPRLGFPRVLEYVLRNIRVVLRVQRPCLLKEVGGALQSVACTSGHGSKEGRKKKKGGARGSQGEPGGARRRLRMEYWSPVLEGQQWLSLGSWVSLFPLSFPWRPLAPLASNRTPATVSHLQPTDRSSHASPIALESRLQDKDSLMNCQRA